MEALLEKGFVTEAKIQDNIAFMNSRSPANGAGLVARAWVVGGFKARLHSDVRAAAPSSSTWTLLHRQSSWSW